MLKHLSGVDVVVVDVLVEVVDVDVVDVDDHDVEELVLDDVLDDVLDVVEVVGGVVVVSHPLQVLAQCVTFANRLSHKPCNLNATHCLRDKVLILPSHSSTADVLRNAEADAVMVVDVDVVRVVLSHLLHVLSQPLGETSVSHKPLAKIA